MNMPTMINKLQRSLWSRIDDHTTRGVLWRWYPGVVRCSSNEFEPLGVERVRAHRAAKRTLLLLPRQGRACCWSGPGAPPLVYHVMVTLQSGILQDTTYSPVPHNFILYLVLFHGLWRRTQLAHSLWGHNMLRDFSVCLYGYFCMLYSTCDHVTVSTDWFGS